MMGSDKCGSHGSPLTGRRPLNPNDDHVVVDGVPKSYTEAICELVQNGLRKHRVSRHLRMAPATVASWLERGAADVEVGNRSEFSEFYLSYRQAEAEFVVDQLQRVNGAAKTDWRAAVKLLELVERDDFALTAKPNQAVEPSLAEKHADQLAVLLRRFVDALYLTDEQMGRVPDAINAVFSDAEIRA